MLKYFNQFTYVGDCMFLSYGQIKELGFHVNEDDIESCTLRLHISEICDNGEKKNIKGDSVTMGGYEYPRHMTFITKEKVDLDNGTVGIIFGRQTYALNNVLIFPGFVHPGYNKRLLLQVVCLGGEVTISKRDPIAYIAFAKTDPKTNKPINLTQTWYKNI